jgi:hypothetical protein
MSPARPSTIEVEGRTYQYDYDYDYDIYYRVHNQPPETPRERWTKVAVASLLLLLICLFAHFFLHN